MDVPLQMKWLTGNPVNSDIKCDHENAVLASAFIATIYQYHKGM